MADDNPTLSQVPEGVNGYVVEAAAGRRQLVMDALYHHGSSARIPSWSKRQLRHSRRSKSD